MKTFIIWLGMVFVLSVYPFEGPEAAGAYTDKLFHAVIYAITCALFFTSLRHRAGRWALPLSVLLASGYGLLMEVAQHFTEYRSFSLNDALANLAGASAAALYIWAVQRSRMKGAPDA